VSGNEPAMEQDRPLTTTPSGLDLLDGNCHTNGSLEVYNYIHNLKEIDFDAYEASLNAQHIACSNKTAAEEADKDFMVEEFNKCVQSIEDSLEDAGFRITGDPEMILTIEFVLDDEEAPQRKQSIDLYIPEKDVEGFFTFSAHFNGKRYTAEDPEELAEALLNAIHNQDADEQ
jgi:hypothetical protein